MEKHSHQREQTPISVTLMIINNYYKFLKGDSDTLNAIRIYGKGFKV